MTTELAIYEGQVESHEVDELRAEIRALKADLSRSRAETEQARRAAVHALSALRKQLSPLYRALQAVFGELEAANLGDDELAPKNARVSAVWDSWKSKFPGKPAQIIDALMLHGEMTTTQIGIAIQSSASNVPSMMSRLKKAGLIQKNGNMFSLKQL